MRTYTPRVNRHVTYIMASGKPRSATITAVTNPTTVNLRIGRSGQTVVGAVKESADNQTGVWRVASAY